MLPGNSPGNKSWINSIQSALAPHFSQTKILEYDNWLRLDYNSIIDLDLELSRLKDLVAGWGSYMVFAKSVGTALAVKAIRDGILHPQKCVFVGTPVLWARANGIDLDTWINGFALPTLYIQQTLDPFMPSLELAKYLKDQGVEGYTYRKVTGDDHKYLDISHITNLSRDYYID